MIPDYLELMAKWAAEPQPAAARWFTDRGFTTRPMRGGLLLGASHSVVESVFSLSLYNGKLPTNLPVPDAQKGAIASISVVKPRDYLRKG